MIRPYQTNFPAELLSNHRSDKTPYLLMNLDAVATAHASFKQHLPKVDVYYAVKCNPDIEVLRTLYACGSKFEIASFRELEILMSIGIDPSAVIFSNPVKRPSDIENSFHAGLRTFSYDSDTELNKISSLAPGSRVYVRMATSPASSTVASEGKFGVSPDKCRQLMNDARDVGLEPYGIAFHVGSQMETPDAWPTAIERASALMRDLQTDGIEVSYLDIGGGFPADYGNPLPPLSEYAEAINSALSEHLPYEVSLGIEPGRAIVADAGVMVASVIGLAERGGHRWAHIDVGAFNGMMEALETSNELQFPLADSRASSDKDHFRLTGPSCDSQDTIMFDAELSHDIQVGDTVWIFTSGGYTTSYASEFNGFDIPQVKYTKSS